MRYIVITDLDGTLLDHQTYEYAPALKAIEALNQQDIPLILNSSKTQAEISELCQQLGNQEPFICENGGLICNLGERDTQYLATPRSEFLPKIAAIKQRLGLKYRGFSEATVKDIQDWTGLSQAAAINAMAREATEPLLWQDSESALHDFCQELKQLNLQCIRGGRFYHVMGIFNKASCFLELKQFYAQTWSHDSASAVDSESIKIVALGDSPNDLPMLEQSDYAIVIPSAKGNNLRLDRTAVYYATQPAPYGWQEGIDFWLNSAQSDEIT